MNLYVTYKGIDYIVIVDDYEEGSYIPMIQPSFDGPGEPEECDPCIVTDGYLQLDAMYTKTVEEIDKQLRESHVMFDMVCEFCSDELSEQLANKLLETRL